MFEKLSLLWKGNAPLKDEYRQFVEMLHLSRSLYRMILERFQTGADIKEIEKEVYQSDIHINKLERRIRKSLVTHLTISPGQEVLGCLVLMSIVKDAERLGDFCKDLFDVAAIWCCSCADFYYSDIISTFTKYVSDVYDDTIEAFENEDAVLASEIIRDESKWDKRFDHFIGEVARSDIATCEAVCTVLMTRTLKRLQAHLANIASSVVLPIHHIDHHPKHLDQT
jgi:phosphate transport system protein